MANNDTEVGISLKSTVGDTASDFNKLNTAIKLTGQYLKYMESRVDAINKFSLGIKRMQDINTDRLNKTLDASVKYVENFVTKFNNANVSNFTKTLNTIEFAMNGFNKQMNAFSKLKLILPDLTKLDFSSITNVDTTKIVELATSFEKMRNAQIEKTSRALLQFTTAMERMGTLNFNKNMTGNLQSQMSGVAETLKQFMDKLQGFNFDGFSRIASDIAKVPRAMKQMESLQIDKIGKVFTTLATQIQPFIAHLKEASAEIRGLANLTSAINRFNGGMKQVKQTTKETGYEAETTRKKLNNMLTFGKVYAFYNQARHYGQSIINVLNKSIDFTEIENYFSRAMGNMRSEAMKFQETLSETFGMATPDMMKAQATFKNMLGSLGGLDDSMTYALSERVTKMVLDYSSLYNTTIESAITKFQAALSKQVRPIRSTSGYDITQNVLESTAQMIGINDRSIQQMNEMEKRLLIILTLQNQMSRSSAMGDFARTIEQPANQLRVFQQQLSEVGRWISAVFYGTIAKVFPYINGFLMAIKEIMKAFAMFIGYEMPDSGSSTGTILDGMEDSMNGFGSSIDDANSSLDDTAKKAKKAAEATSRLGFDEFNTISKPSSSDSDSNTDVGAGFVDPRILDALNKWDYAFGNIRMKANDIRDRLLEWLNILGYTIDDNIFQPIRNSWEKYGAPIVMYWKESWEDIIYIATGVADVLSAKWKPFFQAFSDFYFSVDETLNLLSATVTNFFRIAWDNGGKYLFEKIFDLGTAFLKLATKINDDFVKPVIKWFKDNIVPVIGRAVGAVLKTIGDFANVCANFISWLADDGNPTLKIFASIWGMVKITNLISDFKRYQQYVMTSTALTGALTNNFGSLGKAIGGVVQFFTTLFRDGFTKAIALFPKLNSLWTTATGFVGKFGASIGNAVTSIGGLVASALPSLGGMITKLGGWLSSASFAPWAIGILGAITAITLLCNWLGTFSESQQGATKDISDCSEEIQKQFENFQNLTTAISDAKDSMSKQIESTKVQTGLASEYIDMLRDMSTEDGYVKNADKAKYLIEEINKILPDTVQLTEDGRVAWQKTPEEIQKTIDKTIQLAEAQAYQEGYVESIKSTIEQQRLQRVEQDKLNTLYDEAKASYEGYVNKFDKGNHRIGETKMSYDDWVKALENGDTALSEQIVLVQSMEDEVAKNVETQNYYKDGLMATTEAMGKYNSVINSNSKELSNLQINQRKELDSLAGSLSGSLSLYKDYTSGVIEADENQVESTKNAVRDIINQYGIKATAYELSYDDMLNVLSEQGIQLTEEELNQLKISMDNATNTDAYKLEMFKKNKQETLDELKRYNTNLTTVEENEYAILLDKLNQHGIDVSFENRAQYESLMKAMKDNGIAIDSEQSNQYTSLLGKLSQHGVDIENEQNLQHIARLITTGKAGDEEGKKYIETLKKGVEDGTIDPEVLQLLRDAGIVIDENKPVVPIEPESRNALETKIRNLLSGLNIEPIDAIVKVTADFAGATGKVLSSLGFTMRANGGFPKVGEMFIANEAGPELIGTMGGRTAVANNYQIEAGVARGVAQGMSASGGGSSQPQVVNTHIVVEVDGEVVAKAVDKSKAKKGFNFGMG